MTTVCKQSVFIALLGILTTGCYIFKDIKDLDSDSGVENPKSEDDDIEGLRKNEETDPNNERGGQKSPNSENPVPIETDDSDLVDTGKTDPTDTDELEPTDTDTKEDVTVCKDSELKCEDKCVP